MNDLEKIIQFMVEIEKLKDIYRKSKPVGLDRYENSAEHSWHVCLSALVLRDYANEPVDINHIIKMLLVHDLGEIDAGDTIVYKSESPENKEKEAAGIARIIGMLPEEIQTEYIALWNEFESGETADSKYARAIDRVPPLLQNLNGSGHTWKKNKITQERILELNSRIKYGSKALWDLLENKLMDAFNNGILSDHFPQSDAPEQPTRLGDN
jgi:putative hydrolase of HD superfamily